MFKETKNSFVHDHIEIWKILVEMVVKDTQGSSFQRLKLPDDQDCQILSPPSEQTIPKFMYEPVSDREVDVEPECMTGGVTLNVHKHNSASSSYMENKHDDKTEKVLWYQQSLTHVLS